MANLGDVGQWAKNVPASMTQFTLWAAWPNVGTVCQPPVPRNVGNWFTTQPKPPGVVAAIPTTGTVTLTQHGWPVDQQGGTGTVYFGDLDDGTYYATQAESGGVWRVDVVNNVVTVTQIVAATTRAYASVIA